MRERVAAAKAKLEAQRAGTVHGPAAAGPSPSTAAPASTAKEDYAEYGASGLEERDNDAPPTDMAAKVAAARAALAGGGGRSTGPAAPPRSRQSMKEKVAAARAALGREAPTDNGSATGTATLTDDKPARKRGIFRRR